MLHVICGKRSPAPGHGHQHSGEHMRRDRARAAVGLLAAVTLLVSGCTSAGQGGEGGEGGADEASTLTIAARVDNNSFDPADLEIGNRVQYWQPIYDTLVRLD